MHSFKLQTVSNLSIKKTNLPLKKTQEPTPCNQKRKKKSSATASANADSILLTRKLLISCVPMCNLSCIMFEFSTALGVCILTFPSHANVAADGHIHCFFQPHVGFEMLVKVESPAAFYGRPGNSETSTDSERRSVLMSSLLSANEPHNQQNA